MKRHLISLAAFLLGSALIAGIYLGTLTWAQGADSALDQFTRDRWYVAPIILGFGIQASIFAVLRFGLLLPVASTVGPGAIVGTSGATSTAAMLACCIHHVTDILPVLGIGAAASLLAQYQRPLMLLSLVVTGVGILFMLAALYRERQRVVLTRSATKLEDE